MAIVRAGRLLLLLRVALGGRLGGRVLLLSLLLRRVRVLGLAGRDYVLVHGRANGTPPLGGLQIFVGRGGGHRILVARDETGRVGVVARGCGDDGDFLVVLGQVLRLGLEGHRWGQVLFAGGLEQDCFVLNGKI